jgi:putative membrane protein
MTIKAPSDTKLMVLCIDRDNDLGAQTGLLSPIVGRDKCVIAATRLAIADPEETDANAIFAAVKEFDELQKRGQPCEVAVVTGIFKRGVEADQKLLHEIKTVVTSQEAEGLVLVSDGVEDEEIIPVLQGVKPIVSVRRIVIKHSRSVEESYAVLGRYLRMLIYDSRYSRFFLGVPGLLLLIIGILVSLQKVTEAQVVSLVIIGLALIVRGFDLDRVFTSASHIRPSGWLRLFSALASILIILSSTYLGFIEVFNSPQYLQIDNPQLILEYGPYLLGVFLQATVNYIWIGLGIYLAGSLLYHWLRRSYKILRTFAGLLILALLYFPVIQVSRILLGVGSAATLISLLLIGLAVIFIMATLAYQYIASRRRIR